MIALRKEGFCGGGRIVSYYDMGGQWYGGKGAVDVEAVKA